MSEKPQKSDLADYSKTLFLPQTDFPMRAGLPKLEPEILKEARLGYEAVLNPDLLLEDCCSGVEERMRAYAEHDLFSFDDEPGTYQFVSIFVLKPHWDATASM